jgi:hypothetical protein
LTLLSSDWGVRLLFLVIVVGVSQEGNCVGELLSFLKHVINLILVTIVPIKDERSCVHGSRKSGACVSQC